MYRNLKTTLALAAFALLGTANANAQTYVFDSNIGSLGTDNGQLQGPIVVAVDSSGNVFVADQSNNRIEEFTGSGSFVQTFGSYGSGNGQLRGPFGVALDSNGNLYIGDEGNSRIVKFRNSSATPALSSVLVVLLGAVPLAGVLRRRRK